MRAVGPIVLTMLGDMFTLHERAKMQSLLCRCLGRVPAWLDRRLAGC